MYDFDDEYYGLCKILPDGVAENNDNYIYLDLWTPLTVFESSKIINVGWKNQQNWNDAEFWKL